MSSADRKDTIRVSARWLRSWPQRYGFAVVVVLLAAVLRYGLGAVLGSSHVFTLFYLAILTAALLSGFGPGLMATFLSAGIAVYFFLPPPYSFVIIRGSDVLGLSVFTAVGTAISWSAGLTKQRAATLQEFERVVEGLEEMIVVVDRDYRYRIANRAFLHYRGMKTEDVLGRQIDEILAPGVFEAAIKPKLDECFQGKIVQFEMRYCYPKLGERDLFISYFPIEGACGVDRVASVLQDVTDQKKAERSLKLFRTLIDHSNDAVEVVDPQTLRFLDVNERSCRELGYTREELLSMTVGDIDPNVGPSTCQTLLEKLGQGESVLQQTVHRRKDGSTYPVETSLKYVQLDRGYVIVVARNISERVKAEEALRESEDRYRDLVEHSEDLVCTHDLAGSLLSVNPAPARILGYEVADLLKMPMRELIAPECREQFDQYLGRIAKAGADEGLLCVVTRNGERRIWEYKNTLRTEGVASPIVRGMAHDITERKAADKALRESEEKFRELFQASPVAMSVLAAIGHGEGRPNSFRFLDVNPAFERFTGRKAADFVGRTVFEAVPSADPAVVERHVRVALTGVPDHFEGFTSAINKHWEATSYSPRHGSCITFVSDVTKRKLAEEAQQRSEKNFRLLFEQAPDGIFTIDAAGKFLDANRAGAQMLGYSLDELRDLAISDVLSSEDPQGLKPELDRLANGELVVSECLFRPKGAPTRHGELVAKVLPDGRLQAILRDISDRKRAEAALRSSEQRYRLLFERNVAGVAIASDEGIVMDCNDSWARMLGYDRSGQIRGRRAEEFYFNPAERPALLEKLERERSFLSKEMQLRRKDGSPVWVLFNSAIQPGEENGTALMQATAIDITERKMAEEALRRKEQDYRSFVAQSSEGIFREDLDAPLSLDLPEDELVRRIMQDSYVAECNDTTARMYGFSSGQELVGRRISDMLAANDNRNIEMTREYVRSGFRLLDHESHEVDIHGNPKIFRNSMIGIVEDGKLMRTWGIQRDVTQQVKLEEARRQADRKLEESENHFRLLVEQASDGIFIADAQGKYIDVNSAGAEMLGYTREEVLELHLSDILAAEEIPGLTAEVERLASGATHRSEWTFKRKDGSHFPGEISGKQLPDGRLQGILRDISERRQSEEEMRRNEERFRVALKDSPITVFNQDRELRYTWIYNPQLYWQDEVIGRTDSEIMGTKAAARLVELKEKVLKVGAALRTEVVVSHEGKRHAFDITIEPLLDADGTVLGITGALMDIARLRELTDRLQDAKDKLTQEKSYLESELQTELGFEEIIGQSAALHDVLKNVKVVAPTDSTVLLSGATGTGKELVARSVHKLSSRRNKNFIKLNCAAVPEGLLESELFGHEKGAFTGAVSQKIGRIELADKGTLFLDEIGELPLELQPKLLRVLQDREFERLGGVQTLRVDVRIIAATNRDLRQDIADRMFREDLFYRLNVFPIHLPTLRERRADIPVLVNYFLQKYSLRMGKPIDIVPAETMRVLSQWNWPGNIRELENMIERMVITSKGRVLAAPPAELEGGQAANEESLTEVEREHIIRVLRATNGVLSGSDGAANRLGIKRTTLQSMLKRHGIELEDYRASNGTFGRQVSG